MFIIMDMVKGSEKWDTAFNLALESTHRCVKILLEKSVKSFRDEPSGSGDHQLICLAHAHAVVSHQQRSAPKVLQSELHALYEFSGVCLKWSGRFREAESVHRRFLENLREIYGRKRRASRYRSLVK